MPAARAVPCCAAGYFYKVTTETPYGIGPFRLLLRVLQFYSSVLARIRDEPDINGPRTGEDLIRGAVFEASTMQVWV